jgi:uncharacterized protein YggT (Ycf19 family)
MLLYIFTGTVSMLLFALGLLLVLRALFPLFFAEEGPFYTFLYASTEPMVSPFRAILSRSEFFDSLPFDLSYILAFLTLSVVRLLLTLVSQ